jgi:protocatechuate 3,4-dioxygenase beta subunit
VPSSVQAAAAVTPDPTTVATTLVPLTAGMFEGVGVCELSPDSTAGPFPLEEQFDRYDITEGSPGHPLRIGVRVLDSSCVPIQDARVELWHADATGDYSAFTDGGGGKDDGEGTTFLRGSQAVNGDGIAELHSIAPGWYRGRTVHIHVRVHTPDGVVYTGQLYFDPAWVDAVYANAPYAEFGSPDTSNESDRIAGNMTSTSTADTIAGPGSLALVSLSLA